MKGFGNSNRKTKKSEKTANNLQKDQIISKEVKIMLKELSMFELNFVSIPFGYFEDVGNE